MRLHFGDIALDHPAPVVALSDEQWATFEGALIWSVQGLTASAKRAIAGLEADLARETNLRRLAAQGRLARAAQIAAGSSKIALPITERGMAAPPLKRFDKLKRKLELTTLTEKQREGAIAELADIERRPKDTAEAESIKARLEEVTALESARGVEVALSRSGLMRIDRDGLLNLLKSGAITSAEHTAGMLYRKWVETVQESLGSQMGDRMAGMNAAYDPDREKRLQARLTDARQAILDAEQAVGHGADGRRIMVLRQVAGLGHAISHLAGGGASRARNTAALQIALQILADRWGLT